MENIYIFLKLIKNKLYIIKIFSFAILLQYAADKKFIWRKINYLVSVQFTHQAAYEGNNVNMWILWVRWNSVIRCCCLIEIDTYHNILSSPSLIHSFYSAEVHHMDRICVYTRERLRQDLPSLMNRRDVPTGVFVWAVRLPHPGSVKQGETEI